MQTQRRFSRRDALKAGVALSAVLAGGLGFTGTASAQPFTEWGWPQPYDKVSDASIAWLKEKGWWPLTVGFQPPWTGQNAINIVADRARLLQARGLEATFQPFSSGPDLIEAFTAQRIQVGGTGNFPYTSLIDRKVPARGVINYPVLTHAVIVPNDSKITSLADFKGASEPATIGVVTGSSAEFFFQAAADATGIVIGKDVILKNMPLSEQLQLPSGVAAVVPWDHTVSLITEQRKTGRIVATSHPYNIYEGLAFVRQELIDNVPDVVQAIVDAFFEATLWIRLNPDETLKFVQEDPALKNLDGQFLARQIATNVLLFKPTFLYPQPAFWAAEDQRIRDWLKARNRLTRELTAQEYAASYAPEFARRSVEKLGWAVPDRLVYLPADWTGVIGQIPYPAYENQSTLKEPQPFPAPGDLLKPWNFGLRTYAPS